MSVIANSTIEGNLLRLPPAQLERKKYQDVAKAINLIGGKWKGGKVQAFVFESDPTELVQMILAGGRAPNLKKAFQFFATPAAFSLELVELACPQPKDKFLEPSAGQGAIVKAIREYMEAPIVVDCFELMPENAAILSKVEGARIIGANFLTDCPDGQTWDVIVANPPFSKNQDIEHVLQMYEHLALGGRLVSVMSNHWRQCSLSSKERTFREFIERVEAEIIDVPSGTFKESGTNVATCIVKIVRA